MQPENNLRDQLFPDGPPSPEELIAGIAKYIRAQLGMDEDASDSCHTM